MSSILLVTCGKVNIEEYDSLDYSIYTGENVAGYYRSSKIGKQSYQFTLEYNDRGRGPHLVETIHLNKTGTIDSLEIIGHNYLKDTINERFDYRNGVAIWKSSSENGSLKLKNKSFYIGNNSTYGNKELLLKKILSEKDTSISLLPSGEASINEVGSFQVNDKISLKLYEIIGFSFKPEYYWVDNGNRFFASVSTWFSCVRKGHESIITKLLEYQTNREKAYYKKLAEKLTEVPQGKIIIKNVAVFDSKKGLINHNKTVVISGNKIESVLPENNLKFDSVTIIDGTGKTLTPGLFDMHTHSHRSDGILNIAAGITSVRDMGNSFDIPQIRDDFNNNSVIGPRVLIMSGFIDQAGPYAGPIGKIITTLEEGYEAIGYYKSHGYQQIKLYSSINPDWVKPLARKAAELDMKVSGHIPAFMLAEKAVKDGYNEIQHINMIALNFLSDTIDTRTPLRFSMVGKHAYKIDVKGTKFKRFAYLLKDNNTVLDPTVSIYEGMFTTRAGQPDPQFETVLERLPVQVKRRFYKGGLPIPKAERQNYRASYEKLLEMIYELHTSGVTIVPGSDNMAGFALHKELENYVKAGISESDALMMATSISAKVIGVDNELGAIEKGKLADMILIDGNPLEDIRDIRKVELAIKNGYIYRTSKLYYAIGVKNN